MLKSKESLFWCSMHLLYCYLCYCRIFRWTVWLV